MTGALHVMLLDQHSIDQVIRRLRTDGEVIGCLIEIFGEDAVARALGPSYLAHTLPLVFRGASCVNES
jgi:hypothetical protein